MRECSFSSIYYVSVNVAPESTAKLGKHNGINLECRGAIWRSRARSSREKGTRGTGRGGGERGENDENQKQRDG